MNRFRIVLGISFATLAIVALTGCSAQNFQGQSAPQRTLTGSPPSSVTTSVSPGVSSSTTRNPVFTSCSQFLQANPIPAAAAPGTVQTFAGTAGPLTITGAAAQTVEVLALAGMLTVQGVGYIQDIIGVGGGANISAGGIDTIAGVAGNLCVGSHNLNYIDAAAVSNAMIVADHITQIVGIAGQTAIYKATVDNLAAAGGEVCLYQGAKVLSQTAVAGVVHNCD
jgi:hypothetical protein